MVGVCHVTRSKSNLKREASGKSDEVADGSFTTKEDALRAGAKAWAPRAYASGREATWLYVALSDGRFGYSFPNRGAVGIAEVGIPSLDAILGSMFGDATVTSVFAVGHNHLKGDREFSGIDVRTWQNASDSAQVDLYLWNQDGDASMLNARMVRGMTNQKTYPGLRLRNLDIEDTWSKE